MVELLVAEPQARFRAALCALLRRQPDLHLLDEGTDALSLLRANPRASLLLLGQHHGDARDFDTVLALQRLHPGLRVLVLGSYDEKPLVQAWRAAGARGYLLRDDPPERLLEALRAVARGAQFFLGQTEGQSQQFADGPAKGPPHNLH